MQPKLSGTTDVTGLFYILGTALVFLVAFALWYCPRHL